MATTVASRKQKARVLQQLVRDKILAAFDALEDGDVRSASMGANGVDVQLSPLARKLFPFAVECKNKETINVFGEFIQAHENAIKEKLTPLLIIKKNHTTPLAVLTLDSFMELVKGHK